jgi:hypothetical protein
MADLEKYSNLFGFEYVDAWWEADVIITNTTFPHAIWYSDKPKVKRMDGVYWRHPEVSRNVVLNQAAEKADLVIFISEYSQRAFHSLYPNQYSLKKSVVIRNNVDDGIFYGKRKDYSRGCKFVWAASCSNWERTEKRLRDIIKFAEFIKIVDNEPLILIGEINTRGLPSNVRTVGYIDDYWLLNAVLNQADGFVNFSFRDAGCKCVSQAVNVGLPVLYANSGGVPELVRNFGVPINDFDLGGRPNFLDYTPNLIFEDIIKSYFRYKHINFKGLQPQTNYTRDVISKYFFEIRKLVDK